VAGLEGLQRERVVLVAHMAAAEAGHIKIAIHRAVLQVVQALQVL